jgi:hypothetical protein
MPLMTADLKGLDKKKAMIWVHRMTERTEEQLDNKENTLSRTNLLPVRAMSESMTVFISILQGQHICILVQCCRLVIFERRR